MGLDSSVENIIPVIEVKLVHLKINFASKLSARL